VIQVRKTLKEELPGSAIAKELTYIWEVTGAPNMNTITRLFYQVIDKIGYAIDHCSMEMWGAISICLMIVGFCLLKGGSIRGA
jgi:hypothetical protein